MPHVATATRLVKVSGSIGYDPRLEIYKMSVKTFTNSYAANNVNTAYRMVNGKTVVIKSKIGQIRTNIAMQQSSSRIFMEGFYHDTVDLNEIHLEMRKALLGKMNGYMDRMRRKLEAWGQAGPRTVHRNEDKIIFECDEVESYQIEAKKYAE